MIRDHGRLCTVEGCEKGEQAKGWCPAHYKQARRYGDPLGRSRFTYKASDEQAIAERVVDGPGGCWLWTGAFNKHGDPVMPGERTGTIKAARAASLRLRSPGVVSTNACSISPLCVNPDHLTVRSRAS